MATAKKEAPQVKVQAPKSPKAPEMETYTMARAGVTEGASGTIHSHTMKVVQNAKGKPTKVYSCTVPKGEFDHLFNEDGSSKHILGKA